MKILITKSKESSQQLNKSLIQMGHEVINLPTLNITSVDMQPLDLSQCDGLIFTSKNAVNNFKYEGKIKHIDCFCVGAATEKFLRLRGFQNTFSADGDAATLKNLILNQANLPYKNLVYLCGDVVSVDLEKELIKENIKITKIVNYKSEKIQKIEPETLEKLKTKAPDVIFVYSLRSAESFLDMVKKYSLDQLMTESEVKCISKRIFDFFSVNNWKKINLVTPGMETLKL